MLRWDRSVEPTSAAFRCIPKLDDWRYSYGLALDSAGNVWVSGVTHNVTWKIPPDGSTVLGPYPHAVRDEGRVAGKAEAVLSVLEARGIAVNEDDRKRILSCSNLPILDRWLRRATTAVSVAEVVGEP